LGQPSGKSVKKPYLQHRTGVVFRHRPIRHQLNNCMKTLREMIDLIESAQSGRPELRTWGNRSTGETHYSVDGVEVGKDQYYQAWRADQKNQGNPDIKEGIPNDLTPYEAGEAAGLSGEYYENPYPEGSKRHAEFRLGWRDGTKQAEANRDIDEARAISKPEDGIMALKKFSAYLKKNIVDLASMADFEAEHSKQPYVDDRFNGFLTRADGTPVTPIFNLGGKLSLVGPNKNYLNIPTEMYYSYRGFMYGGVLENELMKILGYNKKGVTEEEVDEDQATAKMGLMSAMGSNDNNPADQRRVMAQQAVEQLAAKR
jgi:hypothetical protein